MAIKDIIPVLKGLYKSFDGDFFSAQVEKFGLSLDKKIKDISTGMKQRNQKRNRKQKQIIQQIKNY